ncbi:MAG: Ig-like domain-containing protein [Clostridium sp.]|nr:Ig-like domain-containing protein [Clostridium sp.]
MRDKRIIKRFICLLAVLALISGIFNDFTIVSAAPKLNRKSATLWVGDTIKLKVKNTRKRIRWTSNKKSIATVSSKGTVKAKKSGKAVITANIGNKKYKCKVTVRKTSISKKSLTIEQGESTSLTLKYPKKKVTWYSSDARIAYADGKKVYACSAGEAVITAKCNGKSYSCKVYVLPRTEISDETLTIEYGKSAALMLKNPKAKVAWYSSDTRIAYADGNQVYAKSVGEAVITAKCNGKSYVCNVKVVSGETEELTEDGIYTSKDKVAWYIKTYGRLPGNYITKEQAKALGWEGGSLLSYAPYKCIGGDSYSNYEQTLPVKTGRKYYECDINTLGALRRGAERLVYSNDGLIYYTPDHYNTFIKLYE